MRGKNENKPERGKRGKLLWQFAYIVGTLLLMFLLGLADPDLPKLFNGQLAVRREWLWYSGAAMVGFWGLQSCVYALTGNLVGERVSFGKSVCIAMFGEYYSAVTPFASGGQPMLIAYYKRYGVGAAKASSILAVRYIGYVSSVVVCYIVAMLAQGAHVYNEFPVIFWLTVAGFAVNFASIGMVVMLMVNPTLVRRAGLWVIRLLTRLPLAQKRRDKWETAYLHGVEEFGAAVEYIRRRPAQCVAVLLLSLGSVVCEFSVAYLVYRALGLSAAGYLDLFAMQTFLYLAVSFAPTPGGAGATEGGFYLFFAMVFPKEMLYSAMLVWRLFTYYSQLILGAGFVVADEIRSIRHKRAAQRDALPATDEPDGVADETLNITAAVTPDTAAAVTLNSTAMETPDNAATVATNITAAETPDITIAATPKDPTTETL